MSRNLVKTQESTNVFGRLRAKGVSMKKSIAYGSAVALAFTANAVNAALPAAIGTQLAVVQTDGLELANLVWPVVITLFGALVLFKLFKRFGSQI